MIDGWKVSGTDDRPVGMVKDKRHHSRIEVRRNDVREPDNTKGMRRDILTAIIATGCLPKRSLALLPGTLKAKQKALLKMGQEDIVKEVLDKRKPPKETIWVATVDLTTDSGTDACLGLIDESSLSELVKSGDRKKILSTATPYPERLRIMKNAECFVFFYGIGFDYDLSRQSSLKNKESDSSTIFFTSRQVKGVYEDDGLKADIDKNQLLNTTRLSGLAISGGGNYAVYCLSTYLNTYSRSGETKMRVYTDRLLSDKGYAPVSAALLLSRSEKAFKSYLSPKTQRAQNSVLAIENVYKHIMALPENETGQVMMRIMGEAGWRKKLLSMVLTSEQLAAAKILNFCDGYDQATDTYILAYCVPDIKRLRLFLGNLGASTEADKYMIICYDVQVEFLKSVLDAPIRLRSVKLADVAEKFGVAERGNGSNTPHG